MKNSAMAIPVYFSWCAWVPVSQGLYLGVEMLDHSKFLSSNSVDNAKPFSEVVIPIYSHPTEYEHYVVSHSPHHLVLTHLDILGKKVVSLLVLLKRMSPFLYLHFL